MHGTTFLYTLYAVLAVEAVASTAPISGYGVVDFTWEVETAPGGSKENITGTIEEVIARISTVNPNWKTDFNISTSREGNDKPSKRDLSFPFTSVQCNLAEWSSANTADIIDGIEYLNRVGGIPTNGPGPANCGRVSCSYNSAIWWCNDKTQTFSLPGFSTIAAGAEAILMNCLSYEGPNGNYYLNGHVFAQFLQNWNVIVQGDSC